MINLKNKKWCKKPNLEVFDASFIPEGTCHKLNLLGVFGNLKKFIGSIDKMNEDDFQAVSTFPKLKELKYFGSTIGTKVNVFFENNANYNSLEKLTLSLVEVEQENLELIGTHFNNLKELCLYEMEISDDTFKNIAENECLQKSLISIDLTGSRINSTIIGYLSKFRSLRVLILKDCDLSGKDLTYLGKKPLDDDDEEDVEMVDEEDDDDQNIHETLQTLVLDGNRKLTIPDYQALELFKNINRFSMHDCNAPFRTLKALEKCKFMKEKLIFFDFCGNKLAEEDVDVLLKAEKLVNIRADFSKFQGNAWKMLMGNDIPPSRRRIKRCGSKEKCLMTCF
jgi:hypothetical protein